MKLRLVFCFLLIAGTAFAEPTERAGMPRFVLADVFGTALAFMQPRILDPTPVSDLTIWGLHGITALDPGLVAVRVPAPAPVIQSGNKPLPPPVPDRVRLSGPSGTILDMPAPNDDDSAGWADLAANMAVAAANVSPIVREAGPTAMIRSFFEELFNHLDPYSRYVGPDEAAQDRARRHGTGGVGCTVGLVGRRLGVTDVAPGSPADLAGVQDGDILLAVDGHPTRGASADQVNQWLTGDVGSVAELVLRHPAGNPATIDLERVLVPPDTVTTARDGDLGVITISGFSADTEARLTSALAALLQLKNIQGLVIDLRDNRGGLLRQAVEVANVFITAGTIVETRGRDPLADHDFIATPDDLSQGMKLIVLVDGRTASAAEILAASIADNKRGVVVGSATLGKGLVQTILPLPDGGELFVTWSRVIAPRGWPIQGLGVLPQVCTSNGERALDNQLEALEAGMQPMAAALALTRSARAPISPDQLLALRAPCPAAEASDEDMTAAHFLIDHPQAYQAALLP